MSHQPIALFDPHRESVEEFDGRVCKYLHERRPSIPKDERYERKRRVLLVERSPQGVRQLLRTLLNKSLDVDFLSTSMLLDGLNAASKKYVVSTKRTYASTSLTSSARNRLRRLHQKDGDSVADFVAELEEVVMKAGYAKNVTEYVASQRLVAGLRSFEARATLVDLMERPVGAVYTDLRKAALKLDGRGSDGPDGPDSRARRADGAGGGGGGGDSASNQSWTPRDGSDQGQRQWYQQFGNDNGVGLQLSGSDGAAAQRSGSVAQQKFAQQQTSGPSSNGPLLDKLWYERVGRQANDGPRQSSSDREQGICVQVWTAGSNKGGPDRQVVRAVKVGDSVGSFGIGVSCLKWGGGAGVNAAGTAGQQGGLQSLWGGPQEGAQGAARAAPPLPRSSPSQAECGRCGLVTPSSLGGCPRCCQAMQFHLGNLF